MRKCAKTAFLLVELDFFRMFCNLSHVFSSFLAFLLCFAWYIMLLQMLCWNMRKRAKTVLPLEIVFSLRLATLVCHKPIITYLTCFFFFTFSFIVMQYVLCFSLYIWKIEPSGLISGNLLFVEITAVYMRFDTFCPEKAKNVQKQRFWWEKLIFGECFGTCPRGDKCHIILCLTPILQYVSGLSVCLLLYLQ